MAFRRRLLAILTFFQTVVCYPPQLLYSLGNGETASTSFLPPESGLFVHPFGPRKQWNDSYQELTFVSFPDSRGVLASLGPLHDFVPHALDDPDGPAKSHADFYEVEGHVIGREVALDFPFIQVLFHAKTVSGMASPSHGGPTLCVEMVAVKDDDVAASFCQVDERSGVCLTNVTVPERWWSNFPPSSSSSTSSSSTSSSSSPPARDGTVEVSYVAYTHSSKCPKGSSESNISSLLYSGTVRGGTAAGGVRPEGSFARLPKIRLASAGSDVVYEMSARNSEVLVYAPKTPTFPGRRFRVLVKLRPNSHLKKFSIRAKTKSGLRILGIETHPPWQTDFEASGRRQVAEVVAFNTNGKHTEQASAVFDWLLEVDLHPSKVSLTMDYTNLVDHSEAPDESEKRMNVRIRVANDALEKLVPVLETKELINVSPITGQPQSFSLTVFAVSGDKVDDVTERSTCFSSDEAVLQVSEICGAYFTRGTETRGSTRVAIRIRYGGQEIAVPLKVWMLETPVQVELSDSKLSLMAGWKIPLFDPGSFSKKDSTRTGTSPRTPLSCQARFQSSTVDLYTRLVAHEPAPPPTPDHPKVTTTTASISSSLQGSPETNVMLDLRNRSSESANQRTERTKPHTPSRNDGGAGQEKMADGQGQVVYLLHRKATFKVTHLLKNSIHSADQSVVNVDITRKDGIIVADGVKPGKTEIQVESHLGNVIGSRDIRVSMDKVTLDHVKGHATSDLRLEVARSHDFPGAKVVKLLRVTTMTRRYQESPLEIVVGFDDDTVLPLKLVHPDDYVMSVESLDNSVVEMAKSDMEFPKIVARGSGSGDLVSLALGPSRFCPTPRPRPLATGHVHVDVSIPHDDLLTQNDAGHFFGYPSKDIIELDVETVKKNSKFEKARLKSAKFSKVEAEPGKPTPRTKSSEEESHRDVHLEPLPSQFGLSSSSSTVIHVTMYVLLGIFGLALAIFVVNCFFYVANDSNRKSKMTNIFVGKSATIKEVQDWIWIDKKTLERNAVNTKCTRALMSPDEFSRASKASSSNGECRLSSATDFSSEVSCLSSSVGGKGVGLYRGSECSVRIGGPAMPPDDNGNTLPHDHHSLKCGGGIGGSCKQLHSGKNSREHVSLSEQIQVDSDVEMTESFRCIPPDVQLEKLKLHKQQTSIIDVTTAASEASDAVIWKDEKLGMSYEQLMKYFNNLKESNA